MIRSLVTIGVVLLVGGCSSLQTRDQVEGGGTEVKPAAAQEAGTAAQAMAPDALPSQLLTSQDVSRGRKLPDRYRRFEAALRSLDENVLMEEASKFLGPNENDIVILNGLGIFHFQRGRPEAARIFWEKGLLTNSNHPTLLNNIAVLELQKGREGLGLEYLRNAYKQQARHFEVLTNLGALHLRGGQFAKAKDFLEQAQRIRTTQASKKYLALAYQLTGDFKKSRALYEDLLKEEARNVELMFNYASLLVEHMNDPREAMVWLNRISFLGSDDRDLMARVDRLREKAQ